MSFDACLKIVSFLTILLRLSVKAYVPDAAQRQLALRMGTINSLSYSTQQKIMLKFKAEM